MGCFFNSGQVCYAGTRAYVHRSIYEEVLDGLAQVAASQHLGPSADRQSQLGPLISARQHERVSTLVERARASGIAAVGPGRGMPETGHYFAPTILRDVPPTPKSPARRSSARCWPSPLRRGGGGDRAGQ
jgi:aldehyde dehydrogenase (NAD+)/phenylacetaldehyde dehydrogenase